MSNRAETWTRDAAGEYVVWNKPPYRNEETGQLSLVLDGECASDVLTTDEHIKRIQEYYKLVWRDGSQRKLNL